MRRNQVIKRDETHAQKMARKKANRAVRIGYAERNAGVKQDVERFCAYWQGVRRKNGLGSKQARAKFLAQQVAA